MASRIIQRIEKFGASRWMMNAQWITQPFQIVFNLSDALQKTIIFGHIHAHLFGSFVEL